MGALKSTLATRTKLLKTSLAGVSSKSRERREARRSASSNGSGADGTLTPNIERQAGKRVLSLPTADDPIQKYFALALLIALQANKIDQSASSYCKI